jgi:hypothetical protein
MPRIRRANIQNNTIIGGRRAVNLDGNAGETVRNNILEPASGGICVRARKGEHSRGQHHRK